MSQPTRAYVTQDRMTLSLDCQVDDNQLDQVIADALAQCVTLGIDPPIQADALRARISAALTHGPVVSDLLLATGRPPTRPVDGSIEWKRDFFSSLFVEDPETGKVDYRQHHDNSIVSKDDVLATLIPPTPGVPGIDVYGKPIAPSKANMPRIRAGAGVRLDEAANTFIATHDGRLRFAQGVLAVDQTYSIVGSVGLKTGHVSHPGSVQVAKDVEPDSRLEAGGTIHIGGAIEESVVIAGGDVIVAHGIVGGHKTKVHAKGCIECMFAENAELDADHDIRVRRELIQCTTLTRGALLVPDGQIIGGTVHAVGGIDVGQAGSHGGVTTVLVAGIDPALQKLLAERREKAAEYHEQALHLREAIMPFKRKITDLTPKLREKLTVLLTELQDAEDKRIKLEAEMEALVDESRHRVKAEIRVRRMIFPETELHVGQAVLRVTTEVNGPVVAVMDTHGEVKFEAG